MSTNNQPRRPAPTGPRRNREIRAQEVRLIDEDGKQLGVVKLSEALARASELDLDLVEVSPDAKPPVCKLLNWSKEQFLADKERRAAKRRQNPAQTVKEVQLRPGIDDHDLAVKASAADRFLAKGHKVRVVVTLHGRMAARPLEADRALERFLTLLGEHQLDGEASRSGRKTVQVVAPKGATVSKGQKKNSKPAEAPAKVDE
jgi:translation initiation factor IF-3